jgi:hypothetical protein
MGASLCSIWASTEEAAKMELESHAEALSQQSKFKEAVPLLRSFQPWCA